MSRYPELAAKVDSMFARVEARHGDQMKCGSGCSHCCHVRLSVTQVEADAISDEVSTWTADRTAELAANLDAAPQDRCAALTPSGHCLIYQVRPIVCRSHGAPIKLVQPGSLPVLTVCRENFTAHGPEAADADCVFDAQTLAALTLAIERDAGHDGTTRIELSDLLAASTRPR